MDLFERIGNLFSGKGFTSNKERDDEEKRKQAEAAARNKARQEAAKNTPVVERPRISGKTVASGKSATVPNLEGDFNEDGQPLSPMEIIQRQLQGTKSRAQLVDERAQRFTEGNLDEFKNADLYKQRQIRDELTQELKAVKDDPTDLGAQRAYRLSQALAALEDSGAKKEGNPLTFLEDMGRSIVDAGVTGAENVGKGLDMALGGATQKAIDDNIRAAKDIADTAGKLYKAGKITKEQYAQWMADSDKQSREAERLAGTQVYYSDPELQAASVASMGLTAIAPLNLPASAVRTGAASAGATTAKDIFSRIMTETGKNVVQNVPQSVSDTIMYDGGEINPEHIAANVGASVGMSAVFPTVGAVPGLLKRGADNVASATVKRAAQSESLLYQAQLTRMRAEAEAAKIPSAVPVAKGVGSKNIAKTVKQQAEAQVVEAKAVEAQVAAEAKQAAEDATTAQKVAQNIPDEPPKADIPFIETPVPAKPKVPVEPGTKDTQFVSKQVQAAQERVDYLKREMADPAEIKRAEAALAAAKNEAATMEKPAKTVASVAPAKVMAEDIAQPVVTKPVASTPELTKTGTVKQKWFREEADRITTSELPAKEKAQALKKLESSVKKAEGKAARERQVALDAQKPELTKKQKIARANVAEADVVPKAKAKNRRMVVKASGVPIAPRKDKKGGKVTSLMARQAQFAGDPNARMALDSVSPNTKKSHKEALATATEKAYSKKIDEVIDEVNKTDAANLDYQKSADLIAYSNRLAEEASDVASKKKLSPKEKAHLERVREAQVDLYDKIAESEADAARSTSYLGFLYKQLDPAIVARRAIKKMQEADAPYSPKQERQLIALTKDLKTKFDAHDAVTARIENLKDSLGKGTDELTPEQVRTQLLSEVDQLRGKEDALRQAYNEINVMTKEHWQNAVKEGKVSEQKTYGYGFNKYQKLNMLSGVFGRVRDMATTGGTYLDVFIDDMNRALTGKLFNALGNTDKFDATVLAKGGATKRGLKEGFRKTVATFTGNEDTHMGLDAVAGGKRSHKGSAESDRLIIDSADMSRTKLPKTGIRKALSVPANIIRGSVAAPSHLFGELYESRALNRAGLDEARRLGLKGDDAIAYARVMEVAPTQAVKDAAVYTSKEISGLQSRASQTIDGWYRNALYKHATWDGNKSVPGWRARRAWAATKGTGITAVKNTIMPFTSWPIGTGKNIVQRQSILFNYGKSIQKVVESARNGDAKAANEALTHFARGNYNLAKLGVAYTMLTPFLSDDDANGDSYNPPYIKIPLPDGKYWSNDLSILGPLSAPLINVWSLKKAQDAMENGGNPLTAYMANLGSGILNKVGLAGTLNGQGIPALDTLTEVLSSPLRDPESKSKGLEENLMKAATDVASQSIPLGSLQRDLNAMINQNPEFQYSPDTKIYNDDGSANWIETGMRQLGASVVVVNQMMEDNADGKIADSPVNRIIGSKTSSEAAVSKENEIKRLNESIMMCLVTRSSAHSLTKT